MITKLYVKFTRKSHYRTYYNVCPLQPLLLPPLQATILRVKSKHNQWVCVGLIREEGNYSLMELQGGKNMYWPDAGACL